MFHAPKEGKEAEELVGHCTERSQSPDHELNAIVGSSSLAVWVLPWYITYFYASCKTWADESLSEGWCSNTFTHRSRPLQPVQKLEKVFRGRGWVCSRFVAQLCMSTPSLFFLADLAPLRAQGKTHCCKMMMSCPDGGLKVETSPCERAEVCPSVSTQGGEKIRPFASGQFAECLSVGRENPFLSTSEKGPCSLLVLIFHVPSAAKPSHTLESLLLPSVGPAIT